MNTKWFNFLMTAAVLGLAAGSWGMVERLLYGLNPVAFGSYVPWGLWVACYLLFLGLSAGAFLVTIMTYLFQMKRFEKIGRLSAFTVLIALLCEVLFITIDLGRMARIYQFLLTPSFSSLMTWMFVLFNAMLILYFLKTFFLLREDLVQAAADRKRRGSGIYRILALRRVSYSTSDRLADEKRVHILSIISLPVGLLFYGTNGAFFAILMNRPIWNSALTPLLFIVAALLSGGALITFLIHSYMRDEELERILGKTILFLLVVFLLLEGFQFFVGYQSAVTAVVTSLDLVVLGPHWWTFWIVHLVVGSLIPLYLLTARRHNSTAISWACFLIVATFIAVRYNFVIPDLAVYKIEGLEQAFVHKRLDTSYVPNLNEWLVSIWIVSLGMIVFLAGTRWLPVVSSGKGGPDHG